MALDLNSPLVMLGIAQTGALIFFAGVVTTTLRNHDKRIDEDHEIVMELVKGSGKK